MPNIYGKPNVNTVSKKEYVGVESPTAKVKVDNNNSTISADVKKVPHKLKIKEYGQLDADAYEYDGSEDITIQLAGEQGIETLISDFNNFKDSTNSKIDNLEISYNNQEGRLQNEESVNQAQDIILGEHDSTLDKLNRAVDQNIQAIGSIWGSINTEIINRSDADTAIANKAKRIAIENGVGDYIGKLKFTDYEGQVNYVQGGYLPDNDTLKLVADNTKIAVKKVYVDSDTLEGTGADSNNTLNAKAIKDNTTTITPTNVTNINLVENLVDNENTGELIFTDYAGVSHTLRSGYLPDGETISLNNSELEANAIKDQIGTITPADIRQDISDINQEISAIEGTGGYLIPFDFDLADPDLYTETVFDSDPSDRVLISSLNKMFDINGEIVPYISGQGDLITTDAIEYDAQTGKATANSILSLLTQYALSQINNISNAVDIWNGTRVENKYNGHTWILNNTPDTNPKIFEWVDLGVGIVNTATNSTQGIVKGSSASLKISVDNTGEMSVNDLSTELSKKQNTLVAGSNITLTAGTGSDLGKTVIAATDTTYSNLSPVNGGVDVSLVTTGDKYAWDNKANKSTISDYTLLAANWSNNQYTLSITGKTALNNAVVSNSNSGTTDADVLANANAIAAANIYRIIDNGTTLTFVCETTPTVDLKIQVEVCD